MTGLVRSTEKRKARSRLGLFLSLFQLRSPVCDLRTLISVFS
jgi:hypothetical protein